jgi:hypothetical protein
VQIVLTCLSHSHLISTARCYVHTMLVTFRYVVCSVHRKHQYVTILQACQSSTKFPRIYKHCHFCKYLTHSYKYAPGRYIDTRDHKLNNTSATSAAHTPSPFAAKSSEDMRNVSCRNFEKYGEKSPLPQCHHMPI